MIPVFGFLPSVLSRQAFNTFITDILNTQFSSRSSDWTSSRPTFWRSALLCGPWAELHVRNTHFSEIAAARIATSVLRQWAIPTSAFLNTGLRPALHVVRFCAQRGHSLKSGRGAAHRKPVVLLARGHLGGRVVRKRVSGHTGLQTAAGGVPALPSTTETLLD